MGDQAEAFLRYRDTGKSQSAVARLERQKGYIAGYAEAVKKKASREEGVALKLLETAAPYMVTNLSKDQYLDMVMAFIGSSQQLGEMISAHFREKEQRQGSMTNTIRIRKE